MLIFFSLFFNLKTGPTTSSAVKTQTVLKTPSTGIFRFQQHARKLFIDNVLNRCTTSYSVDLRQQARKKLFYGDSAPFFALIGVSLASGAGVLTKEDELEGVCWEIREAATKLQNSWNTEDISKLINQNNFDLDHLDVGPPIAKGCAAVVYAAALKNQNQYENENMNINAEPLKVPKNEDENLMMREKYTQHQQPIEMMSPIQNISRFVHNFGGSVDNLHSYNQGVSFSNFENHRSRQHSLSQNSYESNASNQNYENERLNNSKEHFEVLNINSPAENLVRKFEFSK